MSIFRLDLRFKTVELAKITSGKRKSVDFLEAVQLCRERGAPAVVGMKH
jgi:hypothetical protein